MLTLFTKGQAATPAWNAGRFAAATSPAAASSADAATTEGENSAIFTSAKGTATRVQHNHKGTMLGFLVLDAMPWHWAREAVGGARTGLSAEEKVDGARLDGGHLRGMPGRRVARGEEEAEEGERRDGARTPLKRAQHPALHATDGRRVEHEVLVPLQNKATATKNIGNLGINIQSNHSPNRKQ